MVIKPRQAVIGLLLSLTAFSITGVASGSAAIAADQPNTFTAPTHVKVSRVDEDHLKVTWDPVTNASSIITTGYAIKLDGQPVVTNQLAGGLLNSSVILTDAQIAKGGELTVTPVFGNGLDGAASEPVRLVKASSDTPAAVDPSTTSETPSGSGNSYQTNDFGNGFSNPGYSTKNQPTPYEAYGTKAGFTKIVDTLGNVPSLDDFWSALAGLAWLTACWLQIGTSTLLAWTLSRSLYGGLAGAIVGLIGAYGPSELHTNFVLMLIIGLLVWAIIIFQRSTTAIMKGFSAALIWLTISVAYIANSQSLVPKIIQAPLSAVQYVQMGISELQPKAAENDYNLSIKPTYNGDPLEQSVRQMLNRDWLEVAYPAYCQINFGDVKWATTTRVPNAKDLPTFRNLTFCEYLLKAQVESNQKALDRLRSKTYEGGLGNHRTGYVEAASKDAYDFYQGKQADKRFFYSLIVLLATFTHGLLKLATALAIVVSVVLLAWDAFLLAILLTLYAHPATREKMKAQLIGMARKTFFACIAMATLIVATIVSGILFQQSGPLGWMLAMGLRAVFNLIMLGAAIWWSWKLFSQHRQEAKKVATIQESIERQTADPLPISGGGNYGDHELERSSDIGRIIEGEVVQRSSGNSRFGRTISAPSRLALEAPAHEAASSDDEPALVGNLVTAVSASPRVQPSALAGNPVKAIGAGPAKPVGISVIAKPRR